MCGSPSFLSNHACVWFLNSTFGKDSLWFGDSKRHESFAAFTGRLRLLQEQILDLAAAGQNVTGRSFVLLPCIILLSFN